ncbi:hypothetical protein [Streptomyces sp. NPDC007100]|uniref:hypothetical protein n=1 Tax=unclassified Streptomyces TaxID=2593676 RepID=UPI0033FEC596
MQHRGKKAALAAAACGMAVVLGTEPASAAIKPGSTETAAISTPNNSITTSLAGVDHRGGEGCLKTALFTGRVTWHLGKVTKSSIEVKSVDVKFQGLRGAGMGGYYLVGGDGKAAWRTTWRPAPYKPSKEDSRNYKINKTVAASSAKPMQLTLPFTTDQAPSGEPVSCYGQGTFLFQLKPGKYTSHD